MKMRHRAREVALQILYGYEMNAVAGSSSVTPEGRALASDLTKHFEHFRVPDGAREFAAELVTGTLMHVTELDAALEKHAVNWKIGRMASIDRTLLRMSIYEMTRFPEIPHTVTIDEAIELGKQFGSSETSAFLNGILDAIRKTLPAKVTAESAEHE